MGEVTSIQMARRQAVNDRAETEMEKLLGQARFKLIETGTRNRLIHTPRGNKRSRALPIRAMYRIRSSPTLSVKTSRSTF